VRLRFGDPAVLIDPAGNLSWKAIDAREKTQVGHYYLLQHNHAEAWRWYEQAEKEGAKAKADVTEPDPGVFHYLCLSKLGRQADADARLRRFEESYQ
jgi:hypothetical protein